jgi:hypothetical protein
MTPDLQHLIAGAFLAAVAAFILIPAHLDRVAARRRAAASARAKVAANTVACEANVAARWQS